MKFKVLQKLTAFVCALLFGATLQAQTLTSDQEHVIGLAAELYPDLFNSHGPVKTAEGYTYLTFDSGVNVGFKDGVVYVAGSIFGPDIQSRGTISQVTTQLTNLRASVAITPTTDITNLFTYAAQVYPALFANGTPFQTSADGYLYKYFDSGLYAAIKNNIVYVKGGAYGNAYTSVGALNNLLSQLQTAVNGNNNGGNNNGGNNGGGTTIPQGNYNLTVSGTITLSGPVAINQPFSFSIANVPAPDVNDHDDIEEAFLDSLENSAVTITSFSYDVVSSTANLVEFNVTVAATISQGGVNMGYTYKLNYKYTK